MCDLSDGRRFQNLSHNLNVFNETRKEKYCKVTEERRTDILRELKPSLKKTRSLTWNESEVKENFVLANLIVTKGKKIERTIYLRICLKKPNKNSKM